MEPVSEMMPENHSDEVRGTRICVSFFQVGGGVEQGEGKRGR